MTSTAPGTAVPAYLASAIQQQQSSSRTELIVGTGIAVIGGLIGLGWGIRTNTRDSSEGGTASASPVWRDALEGFIIGFIIAIATVLVLHAWHHAPVLNAQRRIVQAQQQAAVNNVQFQSLYDQARLRQQTLEALGSNIPSGGSLGQMYNNLVGTTVST